MSEQIHGHEVMHMMMEDGRAYTKATLRSAIVERFGVEARFFTCSAADMTAEELIDFLMSRGKFLAEGDGFRTEAGRMCQD
ncbi:MAG: YecH family metal-binding protein [Georgfuchsia sp.]